MSLIRNSGDDDDDANILEGVSPSGYFGMENLWMKDPMDSNRSIRIFGTQWKKYYQTVQDNESEPPKWAEEFLTHTLYGCGCSKNQIESEVEKFCHSNYPEREQYRFSEKSYSSSSSKNKPNEDNIEKEIEDAIEEEERIESRNFSPFGSRKLPGEQYSRKQMQKEHVFM